MKRHAAMILAVLLLLATPAWAKTTIHVAHPHSSPSSDGLQAVADEFNISNETVEAILDYVPYSNISQDKLQVLVAGGQAPDVVVLADLIISEWALVNGLVPLDSYIARDRVKMNQYWPSSARVVQWRNTTWALPHTQDARALHFNRDHFAAVGLDDVHGPRALTELEEYNKRLTITGGDGSYERIGLIPWAAEGWFYTWGWLFGAEFYDDVAEKVTPTDPKAIRAMEWLGSYARSFPPNLIDGLNNFWGGKSSTVVHGVWGLGEWKTLFPDVNMGVLPLPPPEDEGPSTWSGIWALGISSASKYPEAAWEFIKFATSVEGEGIYVKVAPNIMANREAAIRTMPTMRSWYGTEFTTYLDLMPYSHERPSMPAGSLYWNELARALQRVIRQEATPLVALEEARFLTQSYLDEVLRAK